MKEIPVKDLFQHIDPFRIHEDPAIALATDGRETNGLTIGWAEYGVLWSKPAATVYVHKTRYSKHIFDGAEYYAICYLKPEHRDVLGYFGSVSGSRLVRAGRRAYAVSWRSRKSVDHGRLIWQKNIKPVRKTRAGVLLQGSVTGYS